MASAKPRPKRQRRNFSHLEQTPAARILEVPNLIDIQRASFKQFMETGIREVINDISPIEDYTGTLAVEFGDHVFEPPAVTERECRETDKSYESGLFMTVAFVNKETGEIREQRVFMGNFPQMTDAGTFIINGTERVVVTQLVRSPGAYIMEPKDPAKQVFTANLMPQRGSWLELEIDKKGQVYARIDRKRKLPVTTLLRALPEVDAVTGDAFDTHSDEGIRNLFRDPETGEPNLFIDLTLEKDPAKTHDQALIEVFKKQRPGEPPTIDNSRKLFDTLFFDPKRYDLTRVGRYKLNSRLGLDVDADVRVLTHRDLIELVRRVVRLPIMLGVDDPEIRDFADTCREIPRTDEVARELDEYEHFGNRRLRTVGELVQEAFRVGLYRMERVVKERMTTEDIDTITPQTIINIRPVVAALKEFFGSSQLSQFMDQTNSLSGLTHRRRLSALGAGGLTRERAPIEVRDVHPTHYGRMCPIETPEGPNIGLIGSLSSYATVSEFGFVQSPYRVVKNGAITKEVVYIDASQEEHHLIAQSDSPIDAKGKLLGENGLVVVRQHGGELAQVEPNEVTLMDVAPEQLVSVATALIPFLEHDDANRALMGSNMMRQAVPLLVSEAPVVGTGLEARAAIDTGDVVVSARAGVVSHVDADSITVKANDGGEDSYELVKFMRSNQGTLIHQKPIVLEGQKVAAGEVLADGSASDQGELALGKNMLVAFMAWEGYNFEDSIILSERVVKDDILSSVHIDEYEVDARSTKLGDEEISRDIPNRSEESLRDLDEMGVVRIGAEVRSGDLLVGKVTPKGETELTAEEKLIRAIFKEKAREVRDTSLKVPHGDGGKVIDVKMFDREAGDELNAGVNQLVRVYVAKKRKISEGDKLAGRHGNKGVISKIVPEEDMPFLEDGTPIDMILNPLGVPSRMNIGQILETHLGFAAKYRTDDDVSPSEWVATPVFDGATVEEVDNELYEWIQKHKDSPVKLSVDDEKGRRVSGKVQLYDGKTGEPYDQKITVGYMYILKLLHLVDDKIHARSTGPYSLVTQQPLGGKAQFGGQRFGEMEVWALEAYGAAHTLQEMLTIKSDDTVGRVKAYEAIVKGENIPEPSVPESFKVLLKEMQSLALDVRPMREDGRDVAVSEEDDELIRAAEELGVDLSADRVRGEGEASVDEADVMEDDTEEAAADATLDSEVDLEAESGDAEDEDALALGAGEPADEEGEL
ncbi:MAG: DNA-directed RNA polymerase subunit beta [Gaiellales bacterium]